MARDESVQLSCEQSKCLEICGAVLSAGSRIHTSVIGGKAAVRKK